MDEESEAVVKEFLRLNEKSKEKFLQIGNLPRSGYKKWQPYFDRAFAVFTDLWRFQQQHREVLSDNQVLKRHHIGEIASKIGQLYYQYYLRTSDTAYLTETYCFYYAIRCRGYYSNAKVEKRPDFMVKKLRYCCRFILVCLVLENVKLANEIFQDLSKDIADYDSIYRPYDSAWWARVADEIRGMLKAVGAFSLTDADSKQLFLKRRLSEDTCPPLSQFQLPATASALRLADVLIVGNCSDQVKFSELSIDMLRMALSLERQPSTDTDSAKRRLAGASANRDPPTVEAGADNPHKYLLYKPTLSEIVFSLNSCFNDLPRGGAVLVYFSADGTPCQLRRQRKDDCGYKDGGVAVQRGSREAREKQKHERKAAAPAQAPKETQCLYPGDLFCFTRRPLLLIVESDNSSAFKKFPNLFNEPVLCLLSPESLPACVCPDGRQQGSLFTLFLHCPLAGMAQVCGLSTADVAAWERAVLLMDDCLREAGNWLMRSRDVDSSYQHFFRDDFLRTIILRFVFCCLVLRLHKELQHPRCYPAAHPCLPAGLLDCPSLQDSVMKLAAVFKADSLFCQPADYSHD